MTRRSVLLAGTGVAGDRVLVRGAWRCWRPTPARKWPGCPSALTNAAPTAAR
ncbi:MAG: hypothetical protein M3422_23540 [Actinomycetota bacterium]|nr:hypothetical protein [Actinomycetota bacterium]